MPLRMMCMCAHLQLVHSQPAQKKRKNCYLRFAFYLRCQDWFAYSKQGSQGNGRPDVSVELLVPVTAYIMFMCSWRFAKLKSSTCTIIDHLIWYGRMQIYAN